jgi:hypothetical protein
VTNSGTDHVREKIARLDRSHGGVAWLGPRVRGNAGKFLIDRRLDQRPGRPRDPRPAAADPAPRRHYHDILAELCGGDFARLTVVGDIFELDLSLPAALGARVGLVRGPTPRPTSWPTSPAGGRAPRSSPTSTRCSISSTYRGRRGLMPGGGGWHAAAMSSSDR